MGRTRWIITFKNDRQLEVEDDEVCVVGDGLLTKQVGENVVRFYPFSSMSSVNIVNLYGRLPDNWDSVWKNRVG